MRIRLLGTGSSDGWPNPWCSCASCTAAAAAGIVRGQTSALVDDRLLIELGPDGMRAALRQGVDLRSIEVVLVTHAHPDHHAWPGWMWRGWAAGNRPLTLLGPPAVLDAAGEHLDPTVTAIPMAPGQRRSVAGYEVLALPATHSRPAVGPALLYDVTGPDGARMLWATDTGVLSPAALALVQDRAYDAVLLDLTSAHLPDHHDLRSWPEQVAELRRRNAVTGDTQLCAVHLGHDNPPPAELDAVLAGWGASAPRDGFVLDLPGADAPVDPPPIRVLVLGGTRSGKSAYAEQRLAAQPAVTYVATAPRRAGDAEWARRIADHRQRRPASWTTEETADVAAILGASTAPVLVDDLGLWLTRQVDEAEGWQGPLPDSVGAACAELVAAWRTCRTTAVLVVPDVGSGPVAPSASGRRFVDLIGALTADLAAEADEVVQVVAGLPRRLR